MNEHSPVLVQQAEMVSAELIRVAILWLEMWHEGLEEASRLYFGERNVKAMFETLEPLHAALEKGPQTLKETSFYQVRVCTEICLLNSPIVCRLVFFPDHSLPLER